MKLEIEVNVSEDGIDIGELQSRLRREAILALFGDRKIPAGQASRELGLSRIEFMVLIKKRGIPYIHYTFEDWKSDLKDWKEIDAATENSKAAGR